MSDFLLELRSEEIPARMQAGARADLEKLFRSAMRDAGVTHGDLTVWSTPRRLALIARDLPEATEAVREEVKGPKTSAPAQALEGFLRKTGLRQDQLTERDGIWFAITERPGQATSQVLAERLPLIIWRFPWPKSMRWGAKSRSMESLKWVRPLSGVVAILGDEVLKIDFDVAHVYANNAGEIDIRQGQTGIVSGNTTVGHRFHHPDAITIGGANDYEAKLNAAHVIVDHVARQDLVREQAKAAAAATGLTLVEDEGLVIENAGLTEWPVPLLGRFDPEFLEVPPEVIQLTARTNQKYFICRTNGEGDQDSPLPPAGGAGGGQPQHATPEQPTPNPSRKREGDLANAFVCTANIAASDGGTAIVDGNRKVLAARLSDARFFWEQDRKKPLAEHAQKLDRITFHEKLGTVADKVERVAKLAEWLAVEGIVPGCDPKLARQAAELCKADLVTEMVGEFPELQGLMGGYYARAEGLPDAVADAIRDHYKPVGQGDDIPTAPVTVAVSLADKLDTLFAFFLFRMPPTGSKDPFALRRAALATLSLMINSKLRFSLMALGDFALDGIKRTTRANAAGLRSRPGLGAHDDQAFDVLDFMVDRLKVQQREAGVRHDLIDAVFALDGEDDLVRLLARVHALQAFIGTEDGVNLLAGFKRAANILKKEGFKGTGSVEISLSYTPEPAEKALVDSLAEAGPRAATAVEAEDFAAAMAALASLRGPIDAFFDSVTVNDPAPEKRVSRLALLDSFRAAVHKVADFSKIEG